MDHERACAASAPKVRCQQADMTCLELSVMLGAGHLHRRAGARKQAGGGRAGVGGRVQAAGGLRALAARRPAARDEPRQLVAGRRLLRLHPFLRPR